MGVSHKGPLPTTEADFALSLLYVSQVLFHPVLDHLVFSLAIPITKMQWAEVLSLPLGLVTNIQHSAAKRMITSAWCSAGQE